MISVVLKPLPGALLSAAVELDRLTLGGLWTLVGYQQELERTSSDLLGIWPLQNKILEPTQRPFPLFAVGCAWSISDETHLILLAVYPELQQRGLGSALLLGLLSCARARGSNYATLEARASSRAAIALYEKFGFQSIGRRPNYYSNPEEDALILWRSGLQSSEFLAELHRHWQVVENHLLQSALHLTRPF